MQPRQIFLTYGLLYANGDAHLGHMTGLIQADIWARTQRLLGHHVHFIGGDDCHGTPIMIKAEQAGIAPEAFVADIYNRHIKDLSDFHISFDDYHSTHSPENEALVTDIYQRLQARGDIEVRTIAQAFDPEKEMFLPDRYVKGECPKCGTADQYGDNCEHCGATYDPLELKNPISTVSGSTPIPKDSEHYFFKLSHYKDFLKEWTQQEHLQPEVRNKLKEWFEAGLKDWDISRDKPYFGYTIPGTTDKYFYVWLDAPIGYFAGLKHYCEQKQLDFDAIIAADSPTEMVHFIGKDILYFHTLFWPALLKSADMKLPDAVNVHSFLTVNGRKMSKSRGTFIKASTYLEYLPAEYLRYYLAGKLSNAIEDIDINFEDFVFRINSELVGKFVNIASRSAGFISKKFEGMLASQLHDEALYQEFVTKAADIFNHVDTRRYSQAIREIMLLADKANQYIDHHKPWQLAKEPEQLALVGKICSQGINLFRVLMLLLKPILPQTALKAETFLNAGELMWQQDFPPLLNRKINPFKPLLTRIDNETIEKLIEASQENA